MEKKKLFTYIAAGCLLLGLIMSFTGVYGAMGITGSLSASQQTWVMILIILIDLVGLAALLLPMFGIMADKEGLFNKCAIAAAILSFILFLIAFFIYKGKASAYGLGSILHISFTGWLLMIFHLGAAVCAFLAGKEE